MSSAEGTTSKDAHVRYLRSMGIDPGEEFDLPELPDLARPTWHAFCELHARRGSGMSGGEAITYEAIDAYTRLTETRLDPWQVRAICALDVEWLKKQRSDMR